MRRRELIRLIGAAAAWPIAARAQAKIPRIGLISPGHSEGADPSRVTLNSLVMGLREVGYTEGQNISIERGFGESSADRLQEIAAELVKRQVDVIVAFSTTAARPAKQATNVVPIVGMGMADPVEDELVASLARPGGNVTGTTFLGPELVAKRLQLLCELVPSTLSRSRSLASACIWRPHDDRHAQGGRARGPDTGYKPSICAGS